MLLEQCAYANRWRTASPAAKAFAALGGLIAAFVAGTPLGALVVTALIIVALVAGAGISLGRFVRIALPPLGFLALGCLSLAYSLDTGDGATGLTLRWLPLGWAPVLQLAARSGCALSALLFLAMTTPMTDLIALLRRLKVPETLIEIMVLCYRMLFVFSDALHSTRTAQAARLGYATPRLALRSLGSLTAGLTLQIWQRAHDLHIAAQSRNNDGALRFLEPAYPHAQRDMSVAVLAACALILIAAVIR